MPLPSDEKLIALSEELIRQFDAIFGLHPGFRPAHAKGILLTGEFIPAPEAGSLTKAAHINRVATPVSVRFSNSTGLPLIPDNDPNSNPRGFAVRFHLAEHVHTDIVAHSTDGFPTRTGEEFLEFLKALADGKTEEFLGTHPAALAFVQTPKPSPISFAHEAYFGVTAFRFTNAEGVSHFGRYRILPEAGIAHLDDSAASAKGPEFLMEEIKERIAAGPVSYGIQVQVAEDGDVVNDATIHWPEDRPLKPFGRITLTEVIAAQEAEQRKIIFDPIPRLEGIEPSDDPLLELRAAVYLLSGRRRRAAIR
jgi:catalase